MLEGILSFLKALNRILALMDRLGRLYVENNIDQWLTEVEASTDLLEKANSADEKKIAAKALVDIVRTVK